MNYDISSILVLAFPLASFVILALSSRKISTRLAGSIATFSLVMTALLSLYTAYGYFFEFGKVADVYTRHIALQFSWLTFSNDLSINMGVMLDPISVMMLVVISLVSCMVHIYSLSYMHGEDRFNTYYAYLSLFTFSMLGLVIAENIFQMYIFWELVGISSYLLIGFYFTKASAVAAAKKAFIVTRFADLGFLVGILMLSYCARTLDFPTLIERLTQPGSPYLATFAGAGFLGLSTLSWALLLVFIGGAGKSAMFPLHIWLPDAMEGPTPVSALIHAATMVVAGVYLVARLFPVFSISAPDTLTIIAYIGVFSAFFAAVIATTQTDIKRVLAYSTISQIGYMMFALGVAGWGEGHDEGYTASMFHLFTHAFFKALLFLGAGAVIHAIHSNEMKDMGGLRKSLPITHITFLLACLAIAGIPPFAGFFSKEAILSAAYHGNMLVYILGLITSGLTAFYMFRLYFRIFSYKPAEVHHDGHSHEKGNWAMNFPLIFLATGAALAGLIPIGSFVSATGAAIELPVHLLFSIVPVALGLGGIAIAAFLYMKESDRPERASRAFGKLGQWAFNKFYIDEIYLFVTKKVIFNLIGRPAAWFDRNVVDGLMNGTASLATTVSEAIKGMQSGRLQSYAMYFLGGVIVIAAILVIKFM